MEVVAWRVKDFADGWIYFDNENKAKKEADDTGALIQPLYTKNMGDAKNISKYCTTTGEPK